MSQFIISCCSTADLSKEHFEAIDVKYICFHYEMDDVQYSDDLGRLTPRYKIRTKKKVFKATVDKMGELAEGGKDYSDKCYLCHSACLEDAQAAHLAV